MKETSFKFVIGIMTAFLIGFLMERVYAMRMKSRQQVATNATTQTKAVYMSLFVAEKLFIYLSMLVAMSYSVELFAALLAGFAVGHAMVALPNLGEAEKNSV